MSNYADNISTDAENILPEHNAYFNWCSYISTDAGIIITDADNISNDADDISTVADDISPDYDNISTDADYISTDADNFLQEHNADFNWCWYNQPMLVIFPKMLLIFPLMLKIPMKIAWSHFHWRW